MRSGLSFVFVCIIIPVVVGLTIDIVRGQFRKNNVADKYVVSEVAFDGMLARLGDQLTYYQDKELGSTMTTTNRFLRFLDTLAVADSTKTSSFDPADLLKGKLTIYLVLPPEHMRAQSPLLRLWIGSLLRAVVRGGLLQSR
jgi:type IV secretion system protein VirD4